MKGNKAKIDELHGLIRSLDASERRHFAIFAHRHVVGEGNHYLRLFRWMAAMPSYDPAALEARLKATGARTPLTAAKNHLKTLVLRALRDYRSAHDVHTCLLEGLGNLAIYHEKKQLGLLKKEIARLKKLATLHGEYHVLFKIGDYERRLHKETAKRHILQGMEAILAQMKADAGAFQNQMEFTHLLDRIFLLGKMAHDQGEIEALRRHPLLADVSAAQTRLSKIYFHQIHAILHQVSGDNAAAMPHSAAVVRIWEDAPHLIQAAPSTYRRILANYLGICHLLDAYEAFPAMLDRIRQSPCPTVSDKVEVFNLSLYYEFLWRMGTFDWEAVAGLVPIVQRGLKAYEGLLDPGRVMAFYYNAALFLFLSEDYLAARRWFREITEGPRAEKNVALQRIARAISLLCTAATNDLELLAYQLEAAQRHFERWSHGRVEAAVMTLAQAWLRHADQRDLQTALSAFVETMRAEAGAGQVSAFELGAWAAAKRDGIRPLDLIPTLRR